MGSGQYVNMSQAKENKECLILQNIWNGPQSLRFTEEDGFSQQFLFLWNWDFPNWSTSV